MNKIYDHSSEELIKIKNARAFIREDIRDYDVVRLVTSNMEEYADNCNLRLNMIDKGWKQDGDDLHGSGAIRFIMIKLSSRDNS